MGNLDDTRSARATTHTAHAAHLADQVGVNGLLQEAQELILVLIDQLDDLRVGLSELLEDRLEGLRVGLNDGAEHVELRIVAQEVEGSRLTLLLSGRLLLLLLLLSGGLVLLLGRSAVALRSRLGGGNISGEEELNSNVRVAVSGIQGTDDLITLEAHLHDLHNHGLHVVVVDEGRGGRGVQVTFLSSSGGGRRGGRSGSGRLSGLSRRGGRGGGLSGRGR